MREIKFRAWDDEQNKFWHGNLKSKNERSKTMTLNYFFEENSDLPITQFTGLKDKNGVEIYEGDIVCNEGFKEEVKFDKFYGWIVSDEQMLGEVNFARMEVIGNIYENPELLK